MTGVKEYTVTLVGRFMVPYILCHKLHNHLPSDYKTVCYTCLQMMTRNVKEITSSLLNISSVKK